PMPAAQNNPTNIPGNIVADARSRVCAMPCGTFETRKANMQYSPYHPFRKYTSPPRDPLSTTAAALMTLGGGSAATGGAMALTGAGAGIAAANTIAGGKYAAQAGQMKQAEANFEADQDVANSAGEIAAAQRQALDINHKGNLLRSAAVANAAA